MANNIPSNSSKSSINFPESKAMSEQEITDMFDPVENMERLSIKYQWTDEQKDEFLRFVESPFSSDTKGQPNDCLE